MLLGGILEFILGTYAITDRVKQAHRLLGNTFSSVVFSSYGGYWFAYAVTL